MANKRVKLLVTLEVEALVSSDLDLSRAKDSLLSEGVWLSRGSTGWTKRDEQYSYYLTARGVRSVRRASK